MRARDALVYAVLGTSLVAPWAPGRALAQLTLVEEGGWFGDDDLALGQGAFPFALDSLTGFPIHDVAGLNDGIYGNLNSWIGDSGAPGFAGIAFGGRFTVRSIAFGRDNTGQYADRCLGRYVLQYTAVDSPNELTPDGDWTEVGELWNDGICPGLPALRHRYDFPPVEATAIRLIVPGTGLAEGTCIDELEVYGEAGAVLTEPCEDLPDLELAEEGGWFAEDDLALAPGAFPFALDSLAGFPIHDVAGLNDGVYGNLNSWIGNTGAPGFAGIALGGRLTVQSIAFGRDNTGQYADRSLGRYVLQSTAVDSPSELTPDGDWVDIGEARNDGICPPLPGLRHRYNFAPVEATAIRLLVPATGIGGGTCIDELEVYGEAGPVQADMCGPPPPPPDPVFHRGDVDQNGQLQLTDAIALLSFLFLGGGEPRCLEAADADDNGLLQLTDAIRILAYLFLGMAPPAAPGPPPGPCGPDPAESPAALGCGSFESC
ncbi:MAG: hypothetical protein HY721_02975 [Planctomycetes bacterium]|nr:hypothetical protein [Planctomycetota bacterium]